MPPPELFASPALRWPGSIPALDGRRKLAARALDGVRDGQVIGVGSGPFAYLVLEAAARRITEQAIGLTVVCVSDESETAALNFGLTLGQLGSVDPDWAVDIADEVDPDGRLLQFHAGALVRTKLLWKTAQSMVLAAEPSAFVPTLGRTGALAVEVHRDGAGPVARELNQLGADDVCLRLSAGKDGPVFTESGNLLLDACFPELPPGLHAAVTALPGAVETGLFEGYAYQTL